MRITSFIISFGLVSTLLLSGCAAPVAQKEPGFSSTIVEETHDVYESAHYSSNVPTVLP